MRLRDSHLTYCTNVHPGEQLDDVLQALAVHTSAVKDVVSPDAPFAVGLWLSRRSALQLAQPARFAQLARLLEERGLYVPTLNGFPFGAFHGERVKEAVYVPDWRDPARREHTVALARLLARLLPEGEHGSISTLPGGFKPALGEEDPAHIGRELIACVAELHRLEQETGKRIALGLEPEPCCMLETIEETTSFFAQHLQSEQALQQLAVLAGTTRQAAEELLARHLGVCFDACHAAVEFEEPLSAVQALRAARIPIVKLQLSAGLRVARADRAARAALAPYAEDTYLHQVVERRATPEGAQLLRYRDLPDALAAARDEGEAPEWRIHFHVPVFARTLGAFDSTQPFLVELLQAHARQPLSAHLEVETYTWGVLPDALRQGPLAGAIAREIEFCRGVLEGREPP